MAEILPPHSRAVPGRRNLFLILNLFLMTGYRAAIRYGPFRKETGFSEERTIAPP